jgi:virginiamycin B lyase
VTEYGLSGPVGVSAITAGPDGNLWFTEAKRIGRITPTGRVTEFDDPPGVIRDYVRIVSDRGSLVATDSAGTTWRISTTGVATAQRWRPGGLSATGADGAVWAFDWQAKRITRATPAGRLTSYEGFDEYFFPYSMAAGPDGNLWATGARDSRIWRLSPSGQVSSFGGLPPTAKADQLTVGPDGNLWFIYGPHRLGRITPSGVITGYLIPGPDLGSLAAGPDGNLWFTAQTLGYYPSEGKIGRIVMAQLPGHTFEYVAPTNWASVLIASEQHK